MYCFVYILLNKQLRISVISLSNHVLFCLHSVKQTDKNICEKLVEFCIVWFSLLNKRLRISVISLLNHVLF